MCLVVACLQVISFFFFQAEDGIRDLTVTGVQTCALPIFAKSGVADHIKQRPVLMPVGIEKGGSVAVGLGHDPRRQTWRHRWAPASRSEEIGRASCRERV